MGKTPDGDLEDWYTAYAKQCYRDEKRREEDQREWHRSRQQTEQTIAAIAALEESRSATKVALAAAEGARRTAEFAYLLAGASLLITSVVLLIAILR